MAMRCTADCAVRSRVDEGMMTSPPPSLRKVESRPEPCADGLARLPLLAVTPLAPAVEGEAPLLLVDLRRACAGFGPTYEQQLISSLVLYQQLGSK